jgi:hypothetical protein
MKVVLGLVYGPFKNEQEFKQAVLKAWRKRKLGDTFFEIENEEKEPGMPDVLAILPSSLPFFAEFKYADKNGVIEFQKSQPLFYRKHRTLRILIFAWDCRGEGRVVRLEPSEVIEAKSLRIKIPETIDTFLEYKTEVVK